MVGVACKGDADGAEWTRDCCTELLLVVCRSGQPVLQARGEVSTVGPLPHEII